MTIPHVFAGLASPANANKLDANFDYVLESRAISLGETAAVGDGTADDTAIIAATVATCRAAKRPLHIPSLQTGAYYKTTSSIVLASDTLGPVSVIGNQPQWYADQSCEIRGDFDGPVFNCSGTVSTFSIPPSISNVVLRNLSTGSSACCVRGDYSGGLRMANCHLQARNFVVYAANEMISPVFWECTLDSDPGVANGHGKAGYKIAARNAKIYGGRVYSQEVAFDIGGDAFLAIGTNVEFCQVVVRHGGLASARFIQCHLESSHCLVTNATTIPIAYGSNWVDNAPAAGLMTGDISFIGGVFFGIGTPRTNLAVIKSTAGFNYVLNIDGMSIVHAQPIIGNSFAPGTQVALPSGTKAHTRNTESLIVVSPPVDASSGFEVQTVNGYRHLSRLKVNDLNLRPPASNTPSDNGDLVIQATSNTSLTFKFKGSDGTIRSGSITLS